MTLQERFQMVLDKLQTPEGKAVVATAVLGAVGIYIGTRQGFKQGFAYGWEMGHAQGARAERAFARLEAEELAELEASERPTLFRHA